MNHHQVILQYDSKERSTVTLADKAKEFYRTPMKFDDMIAKECEILKKNCRGHGMDRTRIKGS